MAGRQAHPEGIEPGILPLDLRRRDKSPRRNAECLRTRRVDVGEGPIHRLALQHRRAGESGRWLNLLTANDWGVLLGLGNDSRVTTADR